ncbi:MAG: biotin--[acetyl-CoA-carboxylase] ligase [Thermoanaerobaculum sp.]
MRGWPGVNWVWVPEVDSTNALAERLMDAWLADTDAALPPTLICADVQWAGRGRGGRTWQSPRGGVYASFLLWVGVEALPWVPLAAGVALVSGVRALVPWVERALKWPNDLEVDRRKLGGILCGSRVQGERAWTVTGFGVNVAATPLLPGEGRQAVSLSELGYAGSFEAAREALVDTFVTTFPKLLASPEEVRRRWLSESVHARGERLSVRTGSGVVQGEFVDLSPEGLLLLQTGSRTLRLAAGEIC